MCKPRIRVRVQKGPQTREEKKSENKVKMMELTSKQNRKRVEDEKYNRENDFKNNWKGIGKAVSYGGLFFFGDKQSFLCFQVSYCPRTEEIEPALIGMSFTTLGEVPRPFSRFSIVAVGRISD